MKKLLFLALSFASPIFSKTAAAQPADVKALKEEQNERRLRIIGPDKLEVPVDRAQAQLVSTLIKTALENDDEADEVSISDPSATKHVLTFFKRILPQLAKLQSDAAPDGVYSAEALMTLAPQIGALVEKDTKATYPQEDPEAAKLTLEAALRKYINFAHYIDAGPLFEGVLHKYVEMLEQRLDLQSYPIQPQDIEREWVVERMLNFPRVIKEKLSQHFFLLYGTDIDQLLGLSTRTTIPVDTLIAYGYIPDYVIKEFPNLVQNPNEIRPIGKEKRTAVAMVVGKAFPDVSPEKIRFVKGVLRIKHIDPDLSGAEMTPLGLAAFLTDDDKFEVLQELVRAGAKINLHDAKGWTPLMHVARSSVNDSVIKYLIDHGASLKDAIEKLQVHAKQSNDGNALQRLKQYEKQHAPK